MNSLNPVSEGLAITRLANMIDATPRALRHYEDLGLLKPVRTRSGRRLYPHHQCETARVIVLLRRFDIPVEDIRPLLQNADEVDRARRLRDLLERAGRDLAARLEDIRSVLDGDVDLSLTLRAWPVSRTALSTVKPAA